ncbi:MAG: hypothetical protein AAF456_01360 [Planctomycetota bacterium]
MSYARARLWLGISGVGSLVVLSALALTLGWPERLLVGSDGDSVSSMRQFAGLVVILALWLFPLDFLGGYYLPHRYRRSFSSFRGWFSRYIAGVAVHSGLFVVFAMLLLVTGRLTGVAGGLAVVVVAMFACLLIRNLRLEFKAVSTRGTRQKLKAIRRTVEERGIRVPRLFAVRHSDNGYTGGIVGLLSPRIVIPRRWLNSLTIEQLSTVVARRSLAIENGSYIRGMLLAACWNIAGFVICCSLPGAGLLSVASLVTTFCWFTLWSFVGLLILPTLSRRATLSIDISLNEIGVQPDLIRQTAASLDRMQDHEPHRSGAIETIFHPLPSVSRRLPVKPIAGLNAWNAARATLYLSWACFGILSRAVHCNIGRPELWDMLPTD